MEHHCEYQCFSMTLSKLSNDKGDSIPAINFRKVIVGIV